MKESLMVFQNLLMNEQARDPRPICGARLSLDYMRQLQTDLGIKKLAGGQMLGVTIYYGSKEAMVVFDHVEEEHTYYKMPPEMWKAFEERFIRESDGIGGAHADQAIFDEASQIKNEFFESIRERYLRETFSMFGVPDMSASDEFKFRYGWGVGKPDEKSAFRGYDFTV